MVFQITPPPEQSRPEGSWPGKFRSNRSNDWGPVAAGLIAGLMLLLWSVLVSALAIPILHWKEAGAGAVTLESARYDGDVNGIGTLFAGLISVAALLWLRRARPATVASLFGSLHVRPVTVLIWTAALLALNLLGQAGGVWLGVPEVPGNMLGMYRGTVLRGVLVAAIVGFGPVFEELLFRGFLLPIWSRSVLGQWSAVVLTSMCWAALHGQYFGEPFWMGMLLALGILFGAARLSTGGVFLPILLHMLNNAAAVLQMAWLERARELNGL